METKGIGGNWRNERGGSQCHCAEVRGGGGLPNGALNKHPLRTHQRGGDTSRTNKRTAVTPLKRPRAVAASHPTTAEGGTPTQMGQHVVNNDTRLAGGRGGWATRGGDSQEEEVQRASAEGSQDAPGEAGCTEQQEGGGVPP